MLDAVRILKGRLSHVRESSWHFRATKEIWGTRAYLGKACGHYWFRFPLALLALGGLSLILVAICAGATIAGFVPGFLKPRDPSLYYIEESKELFYPYKTLPNGKHIPVAPWEVLLALGILAITYYLVFVNPEMGALWAKTLAAVILGCLFVLLVLKSSAPRLTARLVGAFWNNVCPPLVVLNEEESKS